MENNNPPIPRDPVFTDLYEVNARRHQSVNIMGVVTDFMPPSRSRGTDVQSTFTLQDSISWIDESDLNHSVGGLTVKFFRSEITALPRVQTIGDVVLLRNIAIKEYRGNTTALSSFGTKWTVFSGRLLPSNGIDKRSSTREPLPQWSSSGAPRASPEEEAYALWLRRWSLTQEGLHLTIDKAEAVKLTANALSSASATAAGDSHAGDLAAPAQGAVRNRFITLSEASHNRFCDVVAEVVKVFETGIGKEVYITDYTENTKFYNYPHPGNGKDDTSNGSYMYGDENGYLGASNASATARKDWPGPWGQFVLCVMLFHPHSNLDVKVKDLVSIRNLRCVTSKTGVHLQGKLHTDRERPDQIDISKIKHNALTSGPYENKVAALRERKEEYWRGIVGYSANATHGEAPNGKMSKAQKRRAANKRKKDESQRQANKEAASNISKLFAVDGVECNPHVRCNHPDKSTVLLADILDSENRHYTSSGGEDITLPFVNMTCRARVRVVDFFPPNVEDFARPAPAAPTGDSDDDEPSPSQRARWEWAFYLLVEDADTGTKAGEPERLKLLVAGRAADFLLKLDATNLREDKSTLNKLNLRLWTLWGDLGESKAKQTAGEPLPRPSNRPFECCIQEFGLPQVSNESGLQRWAATHCLVQTTVNHDPDS